MTTTSVPTLAIVLSMAAAIGFATQRGNVCSVLAARQIAELGQTSRLRSFVLASLWSLSVVSLLAWTTGSFAVAPTFPLDGLTVIGAVGYGVATMLNGACVFGTAARILSGNLSYLATLAGIVGGGAFAVVLQLRALRAPDGESLLARPSLAGAVTVGAAALLCAMALWHFWSDTRRRRTSPGATLGDARWPSALAMPVIGCLGGLLLASNQPWNYPVLLRGLGAMAAGLSVELPLVAVLGPLAFAVGGLLAARLGGRARWQNFVPGQTARCFAGGVLMGLAAYLLPGGNDVVLLSGLPSLSLHAVAAYLIMLAVQIALALAHRRLRT